MPTKNFWYTTVVFYKKAVFKNLTICTVKHLVLEKSATLLKTDSDTMFSCAHCKTFKKTCFEKNLRMAAFAGKDALYKSECFIKKIKGI